MDYRALTLRLAVATAVAVATVVVYEPTHHASTDVARVLPGPVDTVIADPANLMYSYGPSEFERSLQAQENAATTITVTYTGFSQQAQDAFQAAVNILAATVSSPAPIRVNASFEPLGTGILGSAGPSRLCTTSAGVANTWYAAALADKLQGSAYCAALGGVNYEVRARFSSNFANWDYGTSGTAVPFKYNFMTVVLHELTHGLGFYGSMYASGGIGSFETPPDIYDRFAVTGSGAPLLGFVSPSSALGSQLTSNNTFFSGTFANSSTGGAPPKLDTHMFSNADNGFQNGSSYSHLDDVLYTGTPNGLMTYALAQAEVYTDLGPIVKGIFTDIGWAIGGVAAPPTATTGAASGIGASSATLNGTVNPNGTATSGSFQYGTTTSYGSTLGPVALGSGSGNVALALSASGLTCGTLYHFRIVGVSTVGTTNGSDATFSTSACPQLLTVSKTGTGTGTVTSSPAGINCGSTCNALFPSGQVVTLTATPASGSLLTAWGGDPDCSDGVVTLSAARSCTATFTIIPVNSKILTISKTGSGTVTSNPAAIGCVGICSAFFTTGQVVTLTATASSGWMFGGWSGDADCGDGAVTMSADRSCTATFKLLPAGDVNGDAKGDLLWRQTQTGDVALWLMNGVTVTQSPVVAAGVPLVWQIANVGDLDGDGKADLIWRNNQTGDVAAWLMNGTTVKQSPVVAAGVPTSWQISSVGDLDGDGKADLIWRNNQTGAVAAWLMNGAAVSQSPLVSAGVPLAWQIVGVGDVDGDGKADLVWRHSQTGDVAAWLMDGATVKDGPVVAAVPLAWQVAGIGDLDGDGKADLLWRNTQTGDVAAWLMNGAAVKQGPVVAAGVPLAWQIAALRDVDGDGLADLVWRNTASGDVAMWLMNGVVIKQAPVVAAGVALAWQIQR